MLKHLRIQNIILIEEAGISFEPGLNVLSGETGSGKSAIMGALNLITGDRTDASIIRRGAEKGSVEAIFEIDKLPALLAVLAEAGIDYDPSEDLIIRREITAHGKSRAYINNQMAQMAVLKKIGSHLIDIVGQHANQKLLSIDNHRKILDVYGVLEEDVAFFGTNFALENVLREELEELIAGEAQRLREIEVCRMELEELQEAAIKEGEDEEIFSEFTLLANAESLAQHAGEITQSLINERQGVLVILNRNRGAWESLQQIDSSLAETAQSYQNALIELQEVAYTLDKYLSSIEINPKKMSQMDERLSLINRLKKKYGSTVAEINDYTAKALTRLGKLENADSRIDELSLKIKELESANQQLAEKLTNARLQAAQELQKEVRHQLRALNMPKVEFEIDIRQQNRTRTGEDRIEFFLVPNLGEHRVPVKECASGGELSRLMLALQALLAGKESTPIVVFDEIDSNIGGATANIVGEKLKEIGKRHQVLCVTHFPQVAKHADRHLQISKHEVEGRTITFVKSLDEADKVEELARMQGGSV